MERMVNAPLVSIVTPSYNQADFLSHTIRSVLNQEYKHIEYFIVDGGSTDGSVEIIKSYQDQITWWVSEKDRGQTDAINKGFNQATGEIFAWINSDDILQPWAVSEAVDFFQRNPDVGLVYGDLHYINTEGKYLGTFNAKQTDFNKLRRGAVYIPQPATFWRASLWKEVGPLDPDLYFAMDYDLWVKIAAITSIQYYQGHHWADFRIHDESKTISADQKCWDEMLWIHRRDGGRWLSPLVFKYWIRRLIGPIWRLYKRYSYSSK
jgi:glycosyltransferase involved in cell wall biosynthesis